MGEKIWLISDTHFSHNKIREYQRQGLWETVEDMNSAIIDNWNSCISENDIIFHLGDFALTDKKGIKKLLTRLKGRKSIILGNHERYAPSEYMKFGFVWASRFPIVFDKNFILSHEPILIDSPYINLHGHIHSGDIVYPTNRFFNCCVEMNDYKPIRLDYIRKTFK